MLIFLVHIHYVFVLVAILVNCTFTNLIPIIWVLPMRRKIFNKEYLQYFHREHRRAYPEALQLWGQGILPHENEEIIEEGSHYHDDVEEGGYPDHGEGWYSHRMRLK